jgi:cysteine-rich repeat protein
MVGSSSIDVAIACPDGYTGDDLANPTLWVTECGNGYLTLDETWDDDNVADGDGCSADCTPLETW